MAGDYRVSPDASSWSRGDRQDRQRGRPAARRARRRGRRAGPRRRPGPRARCRRGRARRRRRHRSRVAAPACSRHRGRLQLHGDLRAVAARPGDVRPGQRRGRAQRRRGRRARPGAGGSFTPRPSTSSHAERGGTVQRGRASTDYPKGTAYERSKQRAEELVLAEAEDGIEVVICNPAGVFGPGPVGGGGDRRDAARRAAQAACRPCRPAG